MISVKDSALYDNVLKEFNYDYGNVFVFDGYVISEIKQGITFTWDHHAKQIVEDVTSFLDTDGNDIVYISHRIYSYAVKPNDWLNFFKHSYSLKGYGVVGYTQGSVLNTVIENLFFHKKIKRFNSLEAAVQWATDKALAEVEN
ncbi:hypothetical protein [Psychroserpens luteolus]|uniref:hypothetical protein n=1 Tax=Psychroserpens luteolus TaxID=2855840 RepID=UPI001E3167EE|nr:hypothetical protein [Psychroserpens luteolus]MCD2259842.1 hypothetical protein [Psychroserpens luteolus]